MIQNYLLSTLKISFTISDSTEDFVSITVDVDGIKVWEKIYKKILELEFYLKKDHIYIYAYYLISMFIKTNLYLNNVNQCDLQW